MQRGAALRQVWAHTGKLLRELADLPTDAVADPAQVAEADAVDREDIRQAAQANSIDDFKLLFEKELEGLFVDRMDRNDESFRKVMENEEFRAVASGYLLSKVYARARGGR